MSRRRDPKPPSAVEGTFVTIEVVCSGRRTHEEVSFGQVEVFPELRDEWGGGLNIHFAAEEHFVEGEVTDWQDPQSVIGAMHTTYTLRCRRCRPTRNVPVTKATVTKLCDGLAARGETRLDISALGAVGPL